MDKLQKDSIAAIIVTLAALAFFSWQIFSISQQEVSQFDKYPNAAVKYLNNTIAPERLLDYSPLYLLLHILAFRFLSSPIPSILLLHIACLSLAATLLYLLLRRHVNLPLSIAGTAAFLLGKNVIIYGYILEPEPLMVLFLVATLFFSGGNSRTHSLMTGISLTLCMLTRPSFVPLVLIIPFYYWLTSDDIKRALVRASFFILPVLIGVVAISARNYAVQGFLSPMVMSPGTVLFDGNNPLSLGTSAVYPPLVGAIASQSNGESDYQHAIYRDLARRATGNVFDVREANRYWASKAVNFIVDYPGHFISLTAHRLYYLFHGYRWHDLEVAWYAEQSLRSSAVPFFPFSLISALAIAGLLLGVRRWKDHLLFYAIFLNQMLIMCLTYATDRQRSSIYPLFILFAALAIQTIYKQKRTAVIALPAVLLFTAAFSVKSDIMKDDYYVWQGYAQIGPLTEQVITDRNNGNFEGAKEKAARAEAWATWLIEAGKPSGMPASAKTLAETAAGELTALREESPSRQLDMAILLIEAGKIDQAEALLALLSKEGHRFVYMDGRLPEPLYHLGRIALLRGDRKKAEELMLRALSKTPGDPATLAQLACLTGGESYAGKLYRYYDAADAQLFLGRACVESGQYAGAIGYLGRLTILLPEYAKGRIYLAAALGKTGSYVDAAKLYLSTTGENPGTVLLEDSIAPVFKRWAQDGSLEAVYWYGIVLRQYGRFGEAQPYLEQAKRSGYQIRR